MKFISFIITHPSPNRWEAVNSTHGKLGGTSFKRKRDLIEVAEDRYYGDVLSDSVVLVSEKNWRVK